MAIKKAIIPAGGLGTRFLPATKAIPKEMLPLLDKPAIQYIIEEGLAAGIKDFIMVTSKSKGTIENHFDSSAELESILKMRKKTSLIEQVEKINQLANFIYIRQQEPLGLGHAVWKAKPVIGKDPVAIFLPDCIITGPTPEISNLMKIALQEKCSVVAVQEVPMHEVSRYGIIGVKRQFSPNLFHVKELVEKPSVEEAPSNLALVGRYVLSPNIFEALDEMRIGAGGEIQLTDAIQNLMLSGEKVFAVKIKGRLHDAGTPLGLLKANIDLALKHPDYADAMLEYLRELDKDFLVMEGQAQALRKTSEISFNL